MKSSGILFSGPMVRSILEGHKTQTRRGIIPQPKNLIIRGINHKLYDADCVNPGVELHCPYGKKGDRLWVRETFSVPFKGAMQWVYRADHAPAFQKWTPAIFMPRAFSRITLEIISVRVEHVQDITYKDCEAEGLVHGARGMWSCPGTDQIFSEGRDGYRWLWDSINGDKRPWESNPWVWVISFKRV